MSYDVWLVNEAGEREYGLDRNYTSNVAPMFRKALGGRGLVDLDDANALAAHRALERAVITMQRHADDYRAMEPANGWGSYIGALEFLEDVSRACRAHPEARLRVEW